MRRTFVAGAPVTLGLALWFVPWTTTFDWTAGATPSAWLRTGFGLTLMIAGGWPHRTRNGPGTEVPGPSG
jgi:hypothetical protein